MTPLDRVVPTAARLPAGWHRQQLVRLGGDGWAHVLEAPWDDQARDCLALWARRGLPLVVTRQRPAQGDMLATGLPAPASHGRRRLAVAVAPRDVLRLDEFPAAEAVAPGLPPALAADWHALVAALAAQGCAARVYGGFGWQALTGMAYVHAESDLDLLLPVETAAQADAIARLLALSEGVRWNGPRLDGELLFADGAASAWREWLAYREGRAAQVLVKRLHRVALEHFAAEPA
jgi:phosphoribosyl-dephospho-CoA transferase